jgi:hypothetical protein
MRGPNILFTIISLYRQNYLVSLISIGELETYPKLHREDDLFIFKPTTRASVAGILATTLLHFSLTALFPFSLIDAVPLDISFGSYQGSQPAAVFAIGQNNFFQTDWQSGFVFLCVILGFMLFPAVVLLVSYGLVTMMIGCLIGGFGWVGLHIFDPLNNFFTPVWAHIR